MRAKSRAGPRLTVKETDLLQALSEGLSEREAGLRLRLSPETVTTYWKAISEKICLFEPGNAAEYELALSFERLERRRLEAELWGSESRLNTLLETAPEAILVIQGRSGIIQQANHQASFLFGYTRRELIGKRVEELVDEGIRKLHEAYRLGFLNNVRKREMGYHPQIIAIRRDGTRVELEIALTATPATDDVMVVCKERIAASEQTQMDASSQ